MRKNNFFTCFEFVGKKNVAERMSCLTYREDYFISEANRHHPS